MDHASAAAGNVNGTAEPDAESWRARAAGGTEYAWFRAVPGGTGTTLLALRLARGGGGAAGALQAALHALQRAHPVLRAHLRATPSGPTFAFPSSAPPPVELAPHPAAEDDFDSFLERELNHNPWADAEADDAPVLHATLYEAPQAAAAPACGGATLFIRIHTAACDRAASAALVRELVALLGGGNPAEEEAAAVEAALEERIPQRDAWKPFWARGLDMVGYSINGLRTSTLPFEVTGTARSTQMLRLAFTRGETTRLLDACKENGVKLCAAMAAATLLAARQSKQLDRGQQETYSVATLINCRKFLDPPLDDHNVGFYYSAITNTHTVHGGETLWELAKRCHDSYASAKSGKKHLTDIADLNFLMCRAIESPQLTPAAALRTALVSVFEEPAVYDGLAAGAGAGVGVEDFACCATVHGIGPSVGVFDSVRDGRLECSCMYPSPLHSREQMQEVFDKVKRLLQEGSNASDGEVQDCT